MYVMYAIQECIPTLASFVSQHTNTSVRLASLQALTNLSVTPTYHSQFLPFTDSLIDVAATSDDDKLTLQSLRLLANLTFSRTFVDRLLNCQVSCCLLFVKCQCNGVVSYAVK